jgi:hypothetical protein
MTSEMFDRTSPVTLRKDCSWRNGRVSQSTAFRLIPPVYMTNLEGALWVEPFHSVVGRLGSSVRLEPQYLQTERCTCKLGPRSESVS